MNFLSLLPFVFDILQLSLKFSYVHLNNVRVWSIYDPLTNLLIEMLTKLNFLVIDIHFFEQQRIQSLSVSLINLLDIHSP